MNFIIFFIIYIFAIIGYLGVGIIIYVNFDEKEFNKLGLMFNRMLLNIFYKYNKDDCSWKHNQLFHKNKSIYDSQLYISKYEPFGTIFELICLLFWPIWVIINLILHK